MKLAPPLLALSALAAPHLAQAVGSTAPEKVEITDIAQIGAQGWEDLTGRAVLVEFFAYW